MWRQRLFEIESSFLLNSIIFGSIAAVGYTDGVLEPHISLGYLYLLPLALSALIHPLRWSLVVAFICLVLREWFDPVHPSFWHIFSRNVLAALSFVFIILLVDFLGGQRVRLSEIIRRQRDDLMRELESAAELQRNLLPRSLPLLDAFEIAARMHPAKIVGGDYFDCLPLDQKAYGLVIGDVAGKGAPAALLMPSIKMALTTCSQLHLQPAETLKRVNQLMLQVTNRRRFVTLFYGRLSIDEMIFHYCNAGHFPPLVLKASGETKWLESGGPVLGILPDAEYLDSEIELEPGDLVIFYTDGVIEAHSRTDVEFGRNRLRSLVISQAQRRPSELVDEIYRAVLQFSGRDFLEDDLTVMAIKVKKSSAPG